VGREGEHSVGKATVVVTDDTFTSQVLQSDRPVLVDFWAEWCAPCRMVAPVLEEIATEYADRIRVVKLNIDENPGVARSYPIMHVPTLMVFKNGAVAKTIVGAKPKSALLRDIEEYV
jgi:thioredoxin 1